MSDPHFYGNWIRYGGLVGIVLTGITTHLVTKRIGESNFTWKHLAIILGIFMFPTVCLPLLIAPAPHISLFVRICIVLGMAAYVAAYYYLAINARKNMAEFKRKLAEERNKSGNTHEKNQLKETNKDKEKHNWF